MSILRRTTTTFRPQFNYQKVILFPGDGIGPEISKAFHEIHKKRVTEQGDLITEDTLKQVKALKYALKGPFETPIGKGQRSINVTLRKRLQLFANVRPCKSIKGVNTLYPEVDVVKISGLEHEVVPGVVENLKIVLIHACQNIAQQAFEFARNNNRKTVVACHKADVMKQGDGLFLKVCDKLAKGYPEIEFSEEQIHAKAFKLTIDPTKMMSWLCLCLFLY